MQEDLIKTLEKTKIVSVVRVNTVFDPRYLLEALYQGGISIIEITSTSPGYAECISSLKNAASDYENCFIGAGTILEKAQVDECMKAGADFIVSPCFDRSVVDYCVEKDLPVMPGCMTPTEIYHAWKAGACVVKTFPGKICNPDFYNDMRGPFPGIRMMPTGNVNATTAPLYIEAGAIAVGIGKAIVSDKLIAERSWDQIKRNAESFHRLLTGDSDEKRE